MASIGWSPQFPMSEGSILSSAADNFVYTAANALTASFDLPAYTETTKTTAEIANGLYGDVPYGMPNTTFTQSFSVSITVTPMIRRQAGKDLVTPADMRP